MNNGMISLLLCLGLLAPLPLAAQSHGSSAKVSKQVSKKAADKNKKGDAAEEEEGVDMSDPKIAAAVKDLQKAEEDMKQMEKAKKARSKVKGKWYTSEDKAFAEAKKHNLPVWVVYSDPATCPNCVRFEKDILNSSTVKNGKGLFVGYISKTPLPQYKCTAKPFGYVFTPEKETMIPLPYLSTKKAKAYAENLKTESDKLQAKTETKVTKAYERAKVVLEALKKGEEPPAEEKDEDEDARPMGPMGPNGPVRRPQYEDEDEGDEGFDGEEAEF